MSRGGKSLSTTTAIVLTSEQRDLLRKVALIRAMQSGRGRVSASDVVREAIDAHSASLLAEVSAYQNQAHDGGRA